MVTTANRFFLVGRAMKSRFQPRRQLPTGEVSLSSTAFFRHRKSCAPRSRAEFFRGIQLQPKSQRTKNDRMFKQHSCLNEDNMAFWKKQDRCNNCKQIAVGKQRARSKNETVWEAYIEDWRISLTFLDRVVGSFFWDHLNSEVVCSTSGMLLNLVGNLILVLGLELRHINLGYKMDHGPGQWPGFQPTRFFCLKGQASFFWGELWNFRVCVISNDCERWEFMKISGGFFNLQ